MTKEEIMNTYAIEQGFENWEILCLNYIRTSNDRLIFHFNKVTDLIQEKLKNKIANNQFPVFLYECDGQLKISYHSDSNVSDEWLSYIQDILNTEIL